MPITYSFPLGGFSAIAGASFSKPRLENILLIDNFLQISTKKITSKDIQNYLQATYKKDPSDLRSLISLMKKCGFVSIDNQRDFFPDDFFSPTGKALVHVLRAQSLITNVSALSCIERAFELILQDAVSYIISSKKDGYENFKLLLEIIIVTNTLTTNEYLYALSERLTVPNKPSNTIASEILNNRAINASYSYISTNSGANINDSAIQASREVLQQAGLLRKNTTTCEVINKHKILNLI